MDSAETGMPKLITVQGDAPGTKVEIHHFPFTIGSASRCDHIIAHNMIQPHHASIIKRDENISIIDVNTGSLAVNGKHIKEKTLQSGDVISLAGGRIVYEYEMPVLHPFKVSKAESTSKLPKKGLPVPPPIPASTKSPTEVKLPKEQAAYGHDFEQVSKHPSSSVSSETSIPNQSEMLSPDEHHPPPEIIENYSAIYAGFWQRLGAFLVDAICLGIIGLILCLLFFNILILLGEFCFLIGAVISGMYFVFLLGEAGQGQTLGKKLLKIRVVATNGKIADYKHTAIRFLVFNAFFLHHILGVVFLRSTNHMALFFTQLLLIIPTFMFLMVYGLVIFHKQKKGLHDLVSGTCVIRVKFQNWYIPENEMPEQQNLFYRTESQRTVFWTSGIFAGLLFIWCIFGFYTMNKSGMGLTDLLDARIKIQNELGVVVPNISQQKITAKSIGDGSNPTYNQYVIITIRTNKSRKEISKELDKIKTIIDSYPNLSDHDIRIVLWQNVSIGIAKINKSESFILEDTNTE